MNKNIILAVVIILIALAGYFYWQNKPFSQIPNQNQVTPVVPQNTISSFEECASAGFPVMESFPRRCNANGQTFTENIINENVRGTQPLPNDVINSPLIVQGEARGNWFFEATFPVYLLDANGDEIARSFAQAQEEWMTEDFVYFESKLFFEEPTTATGTLVLEKNNASGLPEHADELRIPVSFE